LGAIIGAAVYTVLPQVVGAFEDWYYVIWGLTIILVLAFMPRGFILPGSFVMRAKNSED
jgi:ABC-type branched-subunit amino acid transport system permease subunit